MTTIAPYVGAVVLVNVDTAHNNGSPAAPGIITRLNPAGTVNVRVLYDTPPSHPLGHHRPEHLTDVQFHDTTDLAVANKAGSYGAFWPAEPAQTQYLQIINLEEKIMAAQDDINTAVTAVQAVTADLTAAAANIKAEIAAINAQLAAAGQPAVDTTALNAVLAPLQAAQAAVDALETPAAPPTSTSSAPVASGESGTGA